MKWILCCLVVGFLMGPITTHGADERTRAAEVARSITTISGVAVSPLLGIGVVGAYDYFRTPGEKKDRLPWYARPVFWLPALLLAGAVALKDFGGAVVPTGWKKPLDVAETIESKISGLVATGAFAPLVGAIVSGGTARTAHELGTLGLAVVDLTPLLNVFTIPLAMAAFFVVWLLGHVINVLILISPFGPVDALLKTLRTSLMGSLAVVHFLNPWLAALLSLLIVLIAALVAGWTFRVMVFGAIFTWDFVTRRRKRFQPAPDHNWMFTARRVGSAPIRTYGQLRRTEDGRLVFQYRPWLVCPQRSVELPAARYVIGRGLIYPTLLQVEGTKSRALFALPPRYRGHEEAVARIYGVQEIRDVGLLKGLKAIWRWFSGGETAAAPASASP